MSLRMYVCVCVEPSLECLERIRKYVQFANVENKSILWFLAFWSACFFHLFSPPDIFFLCWLLFHSFLLRAAVQSLLQYCIFNIGACASLSPSVFWVIGSVKVWLMAQGKNALNAALKAPFSHFQILCIISQPWHNHLFVCYLHLSLRSLSINAHLSIYLLYIIILIYKMLCLWES